MQRHAAQIAVTIFRHDDLGLVFVHVFGDVYKRQRKGNANEHIPFRQKIIRSFSRPVPSALRSAALSFPPLPLLPG